MKIAEDKNIISGIRFTNREIEVLACLLHNRKEKKIADILSISPRTVESHVTNIKLKLSIHSKERIVDFLEISNKVADLKKTYSTLLIQCLFLQKLVQVKNLVNSRQYTCFIINESCDKNDQLLIEENLKKAGILIGDANNSSIYICIQNQNIDFYSNSLKRTIYVCFNAENELNEEADQKYITINKDSNYQLSIIKLLSKIIQKKEIDTILDSFSQELQNINDGFLNSKVSISSPNKLPPMSPKKILAYIAALILFVACLVIGFNQNIIRLGSNDDLIYAEQKNKLDQMFLYYEQYNLSSDNTNDKQLHTNYILLKHAAKTILDCNDSILQQYFTAPENMHKLVKYLDVMHSAGVFVRYKKYDSAQAIRILIKAKIMAENYINNMNLFAVKFDDLTAKEIFNELEQVEGLPECYARILYSLGRSYMMQGDFKQAKNYYIKSEYLGEKLGLIEGYSSRYKGLLDIELKTILLDLEKNNLGTSKNKLLELVKSYNNYKTTDKIYKINYKPFKPSQEVILKNNPLHQVHAGIKLIEIYATLLSITNNIEEKYQYRDLILKEITGYDSYLGVGYLFDNINQLKKAHVLNLLGNTLLQLYDNQISLKEIKNALSSYTQCDDSINDLDFIEQIFKCSRNCTKISDYHRMEAEKGLKKLLKRKYNMQDKK